MMWKTKLKKMGQFIWDNIVIPAALTPIVCNIYGVKFCIKLYKKVKIQFKLSFETLDLGQAPPDNVNTVALNDGFSVAMSLVILIIFFGQGLMLGVSIHENANVIKMLFNELMFCSGIGIFAQFFNYVMRSEQLEHHDLSYHFNPPFSFLLKNYLAFELQGLVNKNVQDWVGNTALHRAISSEDVDTTLSLLSNQDIELGVANIQNDTVIDIIAIQRNSHLREIKKAVVDKIIEYNQQQEECARCLNEYTELHKDSIFIIQEYLEPTPTKSAAGKEMVASLCRDTSTKIHEYYNVTLKNQQYGYTEPNSVVSIDMESNNIGITANSKCKTA